MNLYEFGQKELVELAMEIFRTKKSDLDSKSFEALTDKFFSSTDEIDGLSLQTIARYMGPQMSEHAFRNLTEMGISSKSEYVRANACIIFSKFQQKFHSAASEQESEWFLRCKESFLNDSSETVRKNALNSFKTR